VIETLLPKNVACVALRGDDPDAELLPEEQTQLGRAVESRIREFATARACARRALAALGLPPDPILRGAGREPVWPEGVVGSITHCRGYRAAAVALRRDVVTIGIDAEPDETMPDGVVGRVLLAEERGWLEQAPAGVHWDRLIFSAKESVYKAWFPLTRRRLDFDQAAITLDPGSGTFSARLLVPPPFVDGRSLSGLDGRFLVQDGLVLTAIVLPRANRGCR
jgi:4'-phosphopantetheinyl transferase EntD